MVCSSIILGLIKPIRQMLHRVTMLFEIVLEYAFPGHVLNELDLRITGVREGDTNEPIPWLAHICTFVVLRDAVSVDKLLHTHDLGEKRFSRGDIFDNPSDLTEVRSQFWCVHCLTSYG